MAPMLAVAFGLLAIIGPWIAPADPAAIDLHHQFEGPSAAHWLGTGDNGIDLLSALLHGARVAGIVALGVVSSSFLVGAVLGTLAGLRGGLVDHAITGLADLLQAFPGIVLHVALLAVVASPHLGHLIFALSLPGWVLYARLARAETLRLRECDFVAAAKVLGAPEHRIVLRHILPNLLTPLLVLATSAVGGVILSEATLSFLGLGPTRSVSWGGLLDQGSGVLLRFPHVALVAGSAIALTVFAFNRSGDWLRDHLARQ